MKAVSIIQLAVWLAPVTLATPLPDAGIIEDRTLSQPGWKHIEDGPGGGYRMACRPDHSPQYYDEGPGVIPLATFVNDSLHYMMTAYKTDHTPYRSKCIRAPYEKDEHKKLCVSWSHWPSWEISETVFSNITRKADDCRNLDMSTQVSIESENKSRPNSLAVCISSRPEGCTRVSDHSHAWDKDLPGHSDD